MNKETVAAYCTGEGKTICVSDWYEGSRGTLGEMVGSATRLPLLTEQREQKTDLIRDKGNSGFIYIFASEI